MAHPLQQGDMISGRRLIDLHGRTVDIPNREGLLTHLQFRRFAGCPMCNLHLRSFIQRHDELTAAGIAEVAVFHSSARSMTQQHAEAPFALLADPSKALYREFGVESSLHALLHPRAWAAMIQGLVRLGATLPDRGESRLGLPADFLIAGDGRLLALKYGQHAYDQWSLDELLATARKSCRSPRATTT